MSIWGSLGKIAAGVAAPFTGGASLLAIPAIGAVEGAKGGGGMKGALTGALGGATPEGMAGLGQVAGGFASGEANNRLQRGQLTQNYDRLMLQARQQEQAQQQAALRQLNQTSYVAGGGRPYTPPAGMTSWGFGPKAPSAAQQTGAQSIQDIIMQRLKEGPYQPQPLESYADRGKLEAAANYGGALTGAIGAIGNMIKPRSVYPLNTSDEE